MPVVSAAASRYWTTSTPVSEDADIVYPKSWGALLTTDDNDESARIGSQYTDLDH